MTAEDRILKLEGKIFQIDKKISIMQNKINRLEKQGDLRKTDKYTNCYFDADGVTPKKAVIERLSENIDQEGTILEIKANHLLKKNNYSVEEYFYEDYLSGKDRSLDIKAHKMHEFKIDKTNVSLHINILADCKYRSQLDLLFFETGDSLSNALKFPIFSSPDYDFAFYGALERDTEILTSSKATQLLIEGYNKKGHHLSGNEVYNASSQVYSAVRVYYKLLYNNFIDHMNKEQHRSSYANRLFNKESKHHNSAEAILRDLKLTSVYQLLSGIEYLSFDAIIPVVIFDENRGILKAILDRDYKLVGIGDIKLGLYKFPKGFMFHEHDYHGDYIVLCNLDGLNIFLGCVEKYLTYYERRFHELFEKFPMTLFSLLKPNQQNAEDKQSAW
jgi:hypothetical protein